MHRLKFLLMLICSLIAIIALTPESVRAEGDPPTYPNPIQPPWITGQNLQEQAGSGISSSGQVSNIPALPPINIATPKQVSLAIATESNSSVKGIELAVPQRYQDPDDPTCGAAALGMALDFIALSESQEAPDTENLIHDLDTRGLLYDTGTGAEELAYLARSYGFQGASPFHGWTLEQLAGELASGRPAVVSLGLNGDDQPGHFVTVSGVAADGSWVRYNDPVLGEQTVSAEEFSAAWGSQGYSGLTVQKAARAAASDPLLPWMGLLGAVSVLSVLARTYPLNPTYKRKLNDLRKILSSPIRKGLGGKLASPQDISGSRTFPPYSAPPGFHWAKKTSNLFGMKSVEVIEKIQVPNMVRTWGVVRINRWFEEVPVYRTVKVDRGHWATRYVKVYRTKLYRTIQRYRVKKTYWYRRGWRLYKDTRYEWKTRSIWKRNKVPYYIKQKYWIPKIVEEQRFVRYRKIEHRDPVYGWRMEQRGTKTEEREKTVKRWGVVGTKTDWKLKKNASSISGPQLNPDSTPSPSLTPQPDRPPTPEATSTPSPVVPSTFPSYVEDETTSAFEKIAKWVKSGFGVLKASNLSYNPRPNGNWSVSAPSIGDGQKLNFRLRQNIPGTYYTSGNLALKTSTSILKKWKSGIGFGMAVSVGKNVYDYTLGEHVDDGINSNDFFASTAVDITQSSLTGLAAAGVVAGTVALAGVLGVTAIATAPLWAAALTTAVVGTGISLLVNKAVDIDAVKEDVADGFDTLPGIWENGKVIVSTGVEKAGEAIENSVEETVDNVVDPAQNTAEVLTNTVQGVANILINIYGDLFSGG